MLGQLSAGPRCWWQSACLLKIPAAFGWCGGDENLKDVCYFVHLLCLSFAFTGVVGSVFARCWTRDFAEDVWSISGGCVADVWWWAVVLVNKKPAWRSWTGWLIEVLRFNTNDMLSANTIYVHAVNNPCIVEKEIRSWVNSVSVQSWEWLKEQLTNSSFCVSAWGNLRGVLSL
jgi:hypothetical protein